MAIATIISSLFIFVSFVLSLDAYTFYTRIQTIDGTGVGLHLFFGLVEINDRIPATVAPWVLGNLIEFTIKAWCVTLAVCLLSFGICFYARHREQKIRELRKQKAQVTPADSTAPTQSRPAPRLKLPHWTVYLAILAIAAAIVAGVAHWRTQNPRYTTYGEVVSYDATYQRLLLISVEDASGICVDPTSGSLFTTGISDTSSALFDSAPTVYDDDGKRLSANDYTDALPCGTIVEIVGDGVWQYSSPAGYPGVYTIKIISSRADFITPYLDDFIAQAHELAAQENFTPLTLDDVSDDSKNTLEYREQKSELLAVIYNEIDTLEALTTGEKNALSYQFDCTLGWHW